MVRISVAGSASRKIAPERATPRVVVSLEGPDRAAVLAAVTELHRWLSEAAEAHVASGAATRWTVNSVSARTEERYVPDAREPLRVEVATADVLVRFRSFTALAEWLAEIGSREGVQVQDISWSLTDETTQAASNAMRVAAVRDAQARAAAYAEALGLRDVVLEQIWEDGLRPVSESTGNGMLRKAFDATDSVTTLTLRPEPIVVGAAITADFVATEGTERARTEPARDA